MQSEITCKNINNIFRNQNSLFRDRFYIINTYYFSKLQAKREINKQQQLHKLKGTVISVIVYEIEFAKREKVIK